MAVVRLIERLLPTQGDRGSNPTISNFYKNLQHCRKDKYKDNETGNGPFLIKKLGPICGKRLNWLKKDKASILVCVNPISVTVNRLDGVPQCFSLSLSFNCSFLNWYIIWYYFFWFLLLHSKGNRASAFIVFTSNFVKM